VTVTLANGYGNNNDWIGLFPAGAADNGYVQWTYVGNGVTDRTWTVTMPSATGAYEFRLYVNYARAATSPRISVDVSLNPIPAIGSLSPAAAVVGGPAFTLTVNGTGFTSASAVRWNGSDRSTTFVGATQLRAAIAAADIAALGTALVTVATPAPGGGVSASSSFAISPPPSLAVSSTSVTSGATVTVTLVNGFGGATDWLALAATSAPNTSYVQYVYVGSGVTTRTWTVTMPTTPGTYEFRLFPNATYTRAATSPAITVALGSTPGESPALSVNATSVTAGAAITVTLTNGYGGGTDWLAFAASSAGNTSYLQYTYVGSGVTTRTWTVTAPSTPGTYEFRLFLNNSYTRAATSPVITVQPPATPPTLTVDATSVAPGASVTVTLRDGYGGSTDWMSLAATGTSERSYLKYTYVGGGVTTRAWTVTMPATAGTYEFRLYLNNSYAIAARSAVVTVTQ
jgi:hypothetical protein